MEYKIWFSKIKISNRKKLMLLKFFKAEEKIFKLSKQELNEFNKLYFHILIERDISEILNIEYRKNLDKIKDVMQKNKIMIFSILDEEYPYKLQKINDLPLYLHVRGNINLLNEPSVAVVGSRKASKYGKEVAFKLSKDISDAGFPVVSGLAIGIDSFSHMGALQGKSHKTIAVLGNGLLKSDLYPKENIKLFENILQNNGCIISEYTIEEKAERNHFPARNRIISGISDKLVVAEASLNSGSFITVDFALDQGKDVFVVPGNIYSIQSMGCNKLIQEGANICLNLSDLDLKL
jgi:DNA processing protein